MRLSGRHYLIGILASTFAISLYGVVKASSRTATVKYDANVQTGSTTQRPEGQRQPLRLSQSQEEVDAKSAGCQSCHTATDSVTMHVSQSLHIGCTHCHPAAPNPAAPHHLSPTSAAYHI